MRFALCVACGVLAAGRPAAADPDRGPAWQLVADASLVETIKLDQTSTSALGTYHKSQNSYRRVKFHIEQTCYESDGDPAMLDLTEDCDAPRVTKGNLTDHFETHEDTTYAKPQATHSESNIDHTTGSIRPHDRSNAISFGYQYGTRGEPGHGTVGVGGVFDGTEQRDEVALPDRNVHWTHARSENVSIPGDGVTVTPVGKPVKDAQGIARYRLFKFSGSTTKTTKAGDGTETVITTTISGSAHTGPQKYEAVLAPESEALYAAWIPQGPRIPSGDDAHAANTLSLVLELRDAKTHKLVTDVPYTPTLTVDSSHAPGWCMNFPDAKHANDKPDLFFDTGNPGTPSADGTQLYGKAVAGRARFVLGSRDYGAYGEVRAHLVVSDGSELDAEVIGPAGAHEDSLAVPEDANDNHIADPWERDHGIFDKKLAATWDGETEPAAMANDGDGYGLYDEYRGFYVSELTAAAAPSHRRFDPDKRDLLVVLEGDADGALREGAAKYGEVSGIRMWLVPDRAELAPLARDRDAAHPRWSNFNAHPGAEGFGPKQAAIWIRVVRGTLAGGSGAPPPGTTKFVAPWGDAEDSAQTAALYGTPMTTSWILISPDSAAHMVDRWIAWVSAATDAQKPDNWDEQLAFRGLAALHLDKSTVAAYARAHAGALAAEVERFSVLHELGHATGARHHGVDALFAGKLSEAKAFGGGEPTCPMRYWSDMDGVATIKWLAGMWDPFTGPPGGGSWKFCTHNFLGMDPANGPAEANWPTMHLWDASTAER